MKALILSIFLATNLSGCFVATMYDRADRCQSHGVENYKYPSFCGGGGRGGKSGSSYSSAKARSTGPVYVSSYNRSNGTHVNSYTRSAPSQ